MLYVELTYLNKGLLPTGSTSKIFTDQGEFNSWYRTIKLDPLCVINIMKYNPENNPGQKLTNDLRLLNTPRFEESKV